MKVGNVFWKNLVRFSLLFLCITGYAILNYYKSDFLIDFNTLSIIPNTGVNPEDFQTDPSHLVNRLSSSPKWSFHIFISFAFFILTTAIIHLSFLSRKITCFTIGLFMILFLISMVLLLSGIFINSFDLAYQVNRFIKDHLIQSPFVLVMMAALGYGMNKKNLSI